MSTEGKWRVVFRYNGRLGGANLTLEGFADDNPNAKVEELERLAVRAEGSIFIRGWSVEWQDDPLEDDKPG